MKCRFFTFILVICLVLCIAGCGSGPEHIKMDAKGPAFDTLQQVEDYSDVIVTGVRLEEEETFITRANGMVVTVYTLSQFQITKVHRDDFGSLKPGDVITILENEAYDEEQNVVYHVGGYQMMEPGASYLLLLNRNTMDRGRSYYYVASGVHYGTISLEEDGRLDGQKTRDGRVIFDPAPYEEIWQEAREKYEN